MISLGSAASDLMSPSFGFWGFDSVGAVQVSLMICYEDHTIKSKIHTILIDHAENGLICW
jgi:hypothetical protein